MEYPLDRFSDREPRADGALRATDRRGHTLFDARAVRTVRTAGVTSSCAPRGGARVDFDLRGVVAPGIWKGDTWSAHVGDVVAVVIVLSIFTALSAKVFRWE